jgi:hypothetical protein
VTIENREACSELEEVVGNRVTIQNREAYSKLEEVVGNGVTIENPELGPLSPQILLVSDLVVFAHLNPVDGSVGGRRLLLGVEALRE